MHLYVILNLQKSLIIMRKLYLLMLILVLVSSKSFSQYRGKEDINFPKAELVAPNGEITQIKQAPRIIGQVPGVIGKNYTSSDLMNLPTRNINKISCMT
ncbi:MAG: hypothetical protein CFE21_01020 [Bacteroidetes bacterium B1(2017)]|nr:MAG: hypothetical protein CFE21_01020 [Bacteroidetes bacterium B1(2017)]